MKRLILFLIVLIVLTGCKRTELKRQIFLNAVETQSQEMLSNVGPMFKRFKDSLDLTHTKMIVAAEGIKIYMVRFKSNGNRIYAVSSFGQEVLYSGMMQPDGRNGRMAVLKNGEAVLITVSNGVAVIDDLDRKQWKYYFTAQYHGGHGFCQRMAGESFSNCYKAEADEFCDSFISCIAVDTQPLVVIVIAIACTCKAKPYPSLHLVDSADFLLGSGIDSILHLNKDSLLALPLDTLQ
ncbi:hypothetical protein [Segetibacter koreensis]|uniref:hypothetical protein n=1 Tax=Segetibacter koreensis TaxID=398037 RepID=UPI00037719F2|nr:hypothetical protein [Segetibacter koreensis]